MEYRAQVEGRCQRQRIKEPRPKPEGWRSDILIWVDEWIKELDVQSPFSGDGLRILEAQIDWRVISNSGMDEGVIRPVIGAGGWPLIPGSGIKGLFRRACPTPRLQRWCGSPCAAGDLSPGILRFHGAWPADAGWMGGLLDVAHPQQNWQLGFNNGRESHSAFGVVSLYKPKLQVALSCTDPAISEAEWQEIESTLRQALQQGVGGRTSVGYGSSGAISGDLIFQCGLVGWGTTAKLLDGSAEFRPTMFRAAIRGMALRLFGGLCDDVTARQVVGRLFGSLSREEGQNVGLLATAYTNANTELGSSGKGSWQQPTYATKGDLQWRLMRRCRPSESEALLTDLLAALHGLTMALGGFGKGWRRPDHSIFYTAYDKTPIGCHWQWQDAEQLPAWVHVQSSYALSELLQRARDLARRWLDDTDSRPGGPARWREVIHPQTMRIWTRRASDPDDAKAIRWFHQELKGTALGGGVKSDRRLHVGRLWNRLLPLLGGSGAGAASSSARQARPAAKPFARPSATARPSAMARPGSARQAQPAPRGAVSIAAVHPGPFLETLVLFPEQRESAAFIKQMEDGNGAEAGFRPVTF
jgi:CRISPR-associated protein Cmr6